MGDLEIDPGMISATVVFVWPRLIRLCWFVVRCLAIFSELGPEMKTWRRELLSNTSLDQSIFELLAGACFQDAQSGYLRQSAL